MPTELPLVTKEVCVCKGAGCDLCNRRGWRWKRGVELFAPRTCPTPSGVTGFRGAVVACGWKNGPCGGCGSKLGDT